MSRLVSKVAVGVVGVVGLCASAATAGTLPGQAVAAAAPPVGVNVVQTGMHPGGKVTVTGQGWTARKEVVITLAGRKSSTTTDAAGRFTARVLVPWQTTPGVVTVRAVQGSRAATDRFQVGVDWRMGGMDKAHSFVNPYEKQLTRETVGELRPGWHLTLSGDDYEADDFASIATLGDAGFGCTLHGDVVKFELATGRIIWRFVQDNPTGYQWCSDAGSPYLADNGVVWFGQLQLDAGTGEIIEWGDRTDTTVPFADILLAGGSAYVGAGLRGVDPESAETLWRAPAGNYGSTLLSNGVVYHHDSDALYATDPATGRQLWTRSFEPGLAQLAANGKAVLARGWPPGADSDHILRLDPENGATLWAHKIDGLHSPLTLSAETVYFVRSDRASSGRYLTALDLSGVELWSTRLATGSLNQVRPVLANGIIYLPVIGGVETYDAATGEALSRVTSLVDSYDRPIGPGIAVVDDGHVYLTSNEGIYELTRS